MKSYALALLALVMLAACLPPEEGGPDATCEQLGLEIARQEVMRDAATDTVSRAFHQGKIDGFMTRYRGCVE